MYIIPIMIIKLVEISMPNKIIHFVEEENWFQILNS